MSQNDNGNEAPRGEMSPEQIEAFERRSKELGKRLDEVKTRREPPPERTARGPAIAQAFKIAVELVVGVGFGGLIGWGLDRYFETSGPWFLIVFVFLGFAAGMLNVIRTAQRMQADAEHLQRSAPSVRDGDDDD
ncbi:MAG: AtpZ/AtpI family protein [Hyphomicrobiales bacterium]|nr:AtpZ/AtpI family protein [Hyphomicrobiales bacterium]